MADFCIFRSRYLKKKSFHFLEGTWTTFCELKGQKWKKLLNVFEKTFFYKQVLDFYRPFQNFMHRSKFLNFVKTTGP
jgi:hypothetical protein